MGLARPTGLCYNEVVRCQRVLPGVAGRVHTRTEVIATVSMKTIIKCSCGQRIVSKDVMQTGYYLRMLGPTFVYVKYRCSRCKKLGEQFVKQEDWEEGILRDTPNELTSDEKTRFDAMGRIDVHECVKAHFELEQLASLEELPKPEKSSE